MKINATSVVRVSNQSASYCKFDSRSVCQKLKNLLL